MSTDNVITLPSSVMEKVVESMANEMLSTGLTWDLRAQIEKTVQSRIEASGVLDEIADAIVERVIADKTTIVENVGDAFIQSIGESLAGAYRGAAREIARKAGW